MSIPEIDTPTLKKRLDLRAKGEDNFFLLDVRNSNEQEIALIPTTDLLIPVTELENRLSELDLVKSEGTEILIYCRSGIRSANAVKILQDHGFKDSKNVIGGVLAYSDLVDPNMKKY
jgi:rhodanese-related sulfurtransferase